MFLTPSRLQMLPETPAAEEQTSSAHEICWRKHQVNIYISNIYYWRVRQQAYIMYTLCFPPLHIGQKHHKVLSKQHQLKGISLVLQNFTPGNHAGRWHSFFHPSHTYSVHEVFQVAMPTRQPFSLPSSLSRSELTRLLSFEMFLLDTVPFWQQQTQRWQLHFVSAVSNSHFMTDLEPFSDMPQT